MKTYEERLPLIDGAVEKLGGKWPCGESEAHCYLYKFPHSRYAVGIYPTAVICTRAEFEARAKELGWVNSGKAESNWYERGELPPVGSKAKVRIDDKMHEVEIIAYHGEGDSMRVWVYSLARGYRTKHPDSLRPIQSERDQAIASAEHAIESKTGEPASSSHLGILYDAGWRPIRQQGEEEFVALNCKVWFKSDVDAAGKAYRMGCRFVEDA